MTKKEWLNRGRDTEKVIQALESEIFLTDNDEFKKRLEYKKRQLYEVKEEIYQAIETVFEEKYFVILFERYIAMKTWEQIAEDNHFSRSHVIRLHGEALKRLNYEKTVLNLMYSEKVLKGKKKRK